MPAIPDLAQYDRILVNSSAGKDSQAMLDYLCRLVAHLGIPRRRLLVVHADLGKVEWQGTAELAERQAQCYGVQFVKVARTQGDLLTHIESRGMWPSPKQRYCTSDHKRSQIDKVIRKESKTLTDAGWQHVRILNCLGMRAEESPARAKKAVFTREDRLCTQTRTVDTWLPIHQWTTQEVWQTIKAAGVPYHPAYDLGMSRLSCIFCIFAPQNALVLAGKHNIDLLLAYAAVEERIGHTFRQDVSMRDVLELVAADAPVPPLQSWTM